MTHAPSTPSDTPSSCLDRRRFLATASRGALAALAADRLCLEPNRASAAQPEPATPRRRLKYVGWQVGVTYQVAKPGGLTRDDFMRMLDDMAKNRMNMLSLQMMGFGFFDPKHDGYCWPVANPKLKPMWDAKAINSHPKTEYVREVIEAAGHRGIQVQMFMNWGIWNPDTLRENYPNATNYEKRRRPDQKPPKPSWFFCPDSPDAWQLGLDEVADLFAYYTHPNLVSYGFENLASHDCFCQYTQKKYQEATGKSLIEATDAERDAWARQHTAGLLKKYVDYLHSLRPNLSVWLHTQCTKDWAHDPKLLPGCGFDYLLPHTFHFPVAKKAFHEQLRHMEPNQCVLHFSARDVRPTNYPLWIQTPESIAEKIGWVLDYPGKNVAGILFYNPNAMSQRNIRTVYEQIKRFDG